MGPFHSGHPCNERLLRRGAGICFTRPERSLSSWQSQLSRLRRRQAVEATTSTRRSVIPYRIEVNPPLSTYPQVVSLPPPDPLPRLPPPPLLPSPYNLQGCYDDRRRREGCRWSRALRWGDGRAYAPLAASCSGLPCSQVLCEEIPCPIDRIRSRPRVVLEMMPIQGDSPPERFEIEGMIRIRIDSQ